MLLAVAAVPAVWLTGLDGTLGPLEVVGGAGDAPGGESLEVELDTGDGPDPDGDEGGATPPMASTGSLELRLPTSRPILVGFHEAAYEDALGLAPVGTVLANENSTKLDPPADDERGPDYLVLSSRGRPHPATSAVDVMMRPDDDVHSPVTGRVTEVREYVLYGSHRDVRLEIAPADAPELRVVLIHVTDVRVDRGEEVVAGESVLAGSARPFPFGSQIDRYTEPDRWPHVHIEVKVAD